MILAQFGADTEATVRVGLMNDVWDHDGVIISALLAGGLTYPTGDNARKGAVRKRSQLQTKMMGKKTWTKRDRTTGKFMDQKKAPAKKKFKGVRKER
jgi:hypothetical protein